MGEPVWALERMQLSKGQSEWPGQTLHCPHEFRLIFFHHVFFFFFFLGLLYGCPASLFGQMRFYLGMKGRWVPES